MRTTINALLFAAAAAGMVHADAVNFVAGTYAPAPTGFSGHNTNAYARDGSLATNFSVYGVNTTGSSALTPTTNGAVGYADTAAGELPSSVAKGYVPSKNGLTGTPVPANGEFLFAVGGASGRKGYCRMYSAPEATNAAYYSNSSTLWPLESTAPYRSIGAPMVCSNVNPAYARLGVDDDMIWYPSGQREGVRGSLNTVAGGGNNVLANGDVMVYWRSNDTYAWEALQDFHVVGSGDFWGTTAGGSDFMVGVPAGPSALPNSMVGMPLSFHDHRFFTYQPDLVNDALSTQSMPGLTDVVINTNTVSGTNLIVKTGRWLWSLRGTLKPGFSPGALIIDEQDGTAELGVRTDPVMLHIDLSAPGSVLEMTNMALPIDLTTIDLVLSGKSPAGMTNWFLVSDSGFVGEFNSVTGTNNATFFGIEGNRVGAQVIPEPLALVGAGCVLLCRRKLRR